MAQIAAGEKADFYNSQRPLLAFLARLDEEKLEIAPEISPPDNVLTIALGGVTCYLPLAGLVDMAKEKARLASEIKNLDREIKRVAGLLAGPFAQKAPPHIVQKEQEKLAQLEARRLELEAQRVVA